MIVKTVGDLKKMIAHLPDDLPLTRRTNGFYAVDKQDLDFSKLFGWLEVNNGEVVETEKYHLSIG